MVELAISLPLLILAAAGIFEFGYTFFVYQSLVNSARNGARYGSVADYDSPDGATFEAAIKNVTVYGSTAPAADAKPLAPGLSWANIAVTVDKDGAGVPTRLTVGIVNYNVDAVWRTYTFNKPRTTFTYQGQFR